MLMALCSQDKHEMLNPRRFFKVNRAEIWPDYIAVHFSSTYGYDDYWVEFPLPMKPFTYQGQQYHAVWFLDEGDFYAEYVTPEDDDFYPALVEF